MMAECITTNVRDTSINNLINCETTLSSLSRATNCSLLIDLFKSLLDDISKCVESLKLLMAHISHKNQCGMMLCISQIHKCLPLLLKVIEKTTDSSFSRTQESKRYVVERLRWCLSDLLKEIEDNVNNDNNGSGSKFVQTVDIVLDLVSKLLNLSVKEDILIAIDELKPIVEELLCHAMTIAQVSEPSDYQYIIANSQKVLRAFDQLNVECLSIEGTNSMWRMFSNSLGESLESLEQRVNTSVLRLVLQVFCKPYAPLKSLVEECTSSKPVLERKGADLDEMVVELDLHTDRVMQIGLFAMACTGDARRILNIRSCLASLESLESEIVPTLTAFYLEPTNRSHRSHLKLVTSHWQSEIMELHDLLDAIVDPAAFCQVTLEEVRHFSLSAKAAIDGKSFLTVKEDSHQVIQRTKKLVRLLKTTMGEFSSPSHDGQLPNVIQELSKACHECEVCVEQVSKGQENQDETQWRRVLKRCQLIVSTMKKLHPLLVLLVNTSHADTKQSIGNSIVKKSAELDNSDKSGHRRILPYLDAGKLLSQERSIMYMTPKRQVKMALAGSKLQSCTPRAHRTLFSHNSPQAKDEGICHLAKLDDNLTLGLEITAILDKLSLCCDTLSSTFHPRDKPEGILKPDEDKDVPMTEFSSLSLSSSNEMFSVSSLSDLLEHICHDDVHGKKPPTEDLCPSATFKSNQDLSQASSSVCPEKSSCYVSTLERISDLQRVDEKINILKEQFHS